MGSTVNNCIRFILTTAIFAVVFGSGVLPAAAQEVSEQQYVVQFHDAEFNIREVGYDLIHQFPFSKDPQFQNIYTFRSMLPLVTLQTQFAGYYKYLEVDHQYATTQLSASVVPNDPGFSENSANIDRQWGLLKGTFVEAWDKARGKPDTIVAVIDTGIDATHEDYAGTAFAKGYNTLTKKEITDRVNSDDNGHGTLVAGVIGATTNNGIGIAGAAWDVTLMPVKALNDRGSGDSSGISEAIVWAADNGADVINLSIGGIGFAHDTTLANAITYAFDKNVVIVAAAGNDVAVTGGNLDAEPVFPICDDNGKNMIIGVTATDVNDLKPDFANFGKACIDVSAPGKRILSTINHDPLTGRPEPDSYAYASGTSLAVPFVSGQAALLKSLFPFATNGQIRDRIISTADNVDNLNLSQCGGLSCRGLLGAGRINAARSLQEAIPNIQDGDVVRIQGTEMLYYINGAKKQFITPFVRNQRFANISPQTVTASELERFPEGSFAEPLDGTLVKIPNDETVYYMSKGLRLPITYQVFQLRGFSFANVNTLTLTEVNSWITGSLLTPPDGSLLRAPNNPTVYWAVGGVLHPINNRFFVERGLSIFPVVIVSDQDLQRFSRGDAYIL